MPEALKHFPEFSEADVSIGRHVLFSCESSVQNEAGEGGELDMWHTNGRRKKREVPKWEVGI